MKQSSFNILRIGLAVTFLMIGLLILRSPEAWGNYLSPWAMEIVPIPIRQLMILSGIFDILVGSFLLIGFMTRLSAILATIHIIFVLVASGITEVTIRDIAILTIAAVLSMESPNIDKEGQKM